jgi:type III restriction enzyme
MKNMLPATKAVYEYVVYDSGGVEKGFAEDLEKNQAVRVYAKLPGWFKVPTPLGTYNPDWAVLVEVDGAEKLYFVVETKGSLFAEDLRDKESAKIICGRAHFEALTVREDAAQYVVARNIDDLMVEVVS